MTSSVASTKRTVYVGGLSEEVDERVLRGAFVPFGELVDVQLPLDYETEKHRGFAFIEFECDTEAADAIDNMHEAELFGRTIRVNIARAQRSRQHGSALSSRAVWACDEWLARHAGATLREETEGDLQETRIVSRIERPSGDDAGGGGAERLPDCYLDMRISGDNASDTVSGRVIIRLRSDVCPRTCENFRLLCTHGKGFGYSGSRVHRVVPGFVIQAGDFTAGDGTGGQSVYGRRFDDENFTLKHETFCVSMANSGAHSNGSQFYITLARTSWLDGKHVVFGKVMAGFDMIRSIEKCGSKSGKLSQKVVIHACGQLN